MLKAELRSIYSQLCQDDMPMVRRSAATNLGKFAATIEPAYLKTDIMTIFEDLTHDGNILTHKLPLMIVTIQSSHSQFKTCMVQLHLVAATCSSK